MSINPNILLKSFAVSNTFLARLWIAKRNSSSTKGGKVSAYFISHYPIISLSSYSRLNRTVPPAELEALLLEHAEIGDSGVIGIFSEVDATELPRAYIVPRDLTLLKDPKRAAAFTNMVDAWVKSKVAHYKNFRGGVFF